MTANYDWGGDVPGAAVDRVVGSWMTISLDELHRLLRLPTNVQILAVRVGPDAKTFVIDMAGKMPSGAVQAIYQCDMVRDVKFSCWVPAGE